MNRDVFTELSDLRTLVAKLSEQNAALRAQLAKTWQPVTDDTSDVCACGTVDCFVRWRVEYDGAVLSIGADDVEILIELPENVRLCELVQP